MRQKNVGNRFFFKKNRCSETPEKLTIDPESILGAPKEDLMVKLRRRY